MIDFHTHLLHAVDDGPRTLEEALEMARVAVKDGITTMVATPHGPGGGFHYDPARIYERLAELRAALRAANIPLTVLPGTELRYAPHLAQRLDMGEVLACGDHRAVLLECPNNEQPSRLEKVIFELQIARYRVVLAHPERIKAVQKDPNLLLPLIERDVYMQLTASALTGRNGAPMQKLAELLLTHHMIHLLASDAHGPPPHRPPLLSEACRQAATLIGQPAATALVNDTPAALLNGTRPRVPLPEKVKRRRWF